MIKNKARSTVRIGLMSYIPVTVFALCALMFFHWTHILDETLQHLEGALRQRERGWTEMSSTAHNLAQTDSGALPGHARKLMQERLQSMLARDAVLIKTSDEQRKWLQAQWLSFFYERDIAEAQRYEVAPAIRAYVEELSKSPTYLIDARYTGLAWTDAVLLHSGKAQEALRAQGMRISQVRSNLLSVRTNMEFAMSLALVALSWGSWFWLLRPHLAYNRQMQEQLAHRERRANTTLTSIKDAIVVTDHRGRIETLNQAASYLSGHTLAAAQGKPIDEVFPFQEQRRERPRDEHELALDAPGKAQAGNTHQNDALTTRLRAPDGSYRLIARSSAPITYPNGDIDGIVFVFRDITEKQLQDDHTRHVEKLQAVGQLAAGMAHEFNNVLAIISGASEIYARHLDNAGLLDARGQQYAQTISSIIKRSRGLTEKLLSLARDPGDETHPVDIVALLGETVSMLRQTSDRSISITLAHSIPEGIAMMMGNAASLQSAFLNLGFNSLKAIGGSGEISVSVEVVRNPIGKLAGEPASRQKGDFIKIIWADTGHGIAESDLAHIFDPFFSSRIGKGGSGLGLTIVQRAILANQGFYEVTSGVGKGTSFSIFFPCVAQRAIVVEEPARIASPATAREGQLLVVDDEEDFLTVVTEFLEAKGYETFAARNGPEAVALFEQHCDTIAAVILDINLPGQSGTAAARTMRKISPNCRIIVSTGYIDQFPHRDITTSPFTRIIRKPYDLNMLVSEIERVTAVPQP